MFLSKGAPPSGLAETARSMRLVHGCFVIAALLYNAMLYEIRPVERPVSSIIVYSLAFECVVIVVLAIAMGRRRVNAAEEALRINPKDASALQQWRTGIILSCTFTECIVLFGFLLKFLGADWRTAGPFFAVGILLMLLWTPRLDVPSQC